MEKQYLVKYVKYYKVISTRHTNKYSDYVDLGDGFAKVKKNGKWGILNPFGTIWGRIEYSNIYDSFHEDMIRVVKNDKYGYADKETGRFIECVFDYAEDFSNGIAKVIYHGEQRYINVLGKFV